MAAHVEGEDVEEVANFLRKRRICEDVISNFKEQKMDVHAIMAANNKMLMDLGIPTQGDLLVLKPFAKQKCSAEERKGDEEKDIELKKAEPASFLGTRYRRATMKGKKKQVKGPKKLEEKTRRLEIGWLHQESADSGFINVGTQFGGGTRLGNIAVTSRKWDIVKYAKSLFFPVDWLSEDEVFFDLGNFKQQVVKPFVKVPGETVPKPFNLENYYQSTKLTKLRLYLMTTKLEDIDEDDNRDSKKEEYDNLACLGGFEVVDTAMESAGLDLLDSVLSVPADVPQDFLVQGSDTFIGCSDTNIQAEADTYSFANVTSTRTSPSDTGAYSSAANITNTLTTPSHDRFLYKIEVADHDSHMAETNIFHGIQAPVRYSPSDFERREQQVRSFEDSCSSSLATDIEQPASECHEEPQQNIDTDNSPTSILCSDNHPLVIDTANLPHREVVVHRSQVRSDLTDVFGDEDIFKYALQVKVIDNRGQPEKGEGRGVLLDVLTEFWQESFTALTVGTNEKTPFIRHDLQKKEWEAVARVLVYGYIHAKYFPLQLSQVLVATCLFGEESITPELLMNSFRNYIGAEDREVLDKCLSDGFDSNDDDVLDFLSSYKCYRAPTKDNIRSIISELAHQELVQKPRYVSNCWAPIVDILRQDASFQTVQGVSQLYEQKHPTAKKIIKLFNASPANDAERQSFDHLKRFVKSLEGKSLGMFLHFCTGNDVITCDSIQVSFTTLEGFVRRPVARTCVPILELPSTYESYPSLAEEFTSIMKEDLAWAFDIV